jgi:predicted membrane-bound mannosyltransferase
MAATKETFIITLVAAVIAVGLNQVWNRVLDASGLPLKAPRIPLWHAAASLAIALVVALVLFSSFFSNPSGPLDSIRTYAPWLNRAAGDSPHIHPWYFYLHRLLWFHTGPGPVWTEALILLLAILGGIAGFRRRNLAGANPSFVRFIALYTLLLTGFYTFLAYKTPWCLLSFWHGAILLAGVGAAVLYRTLGAPAWRLTISALLVLGATHLAWQSCWADTSFAADPRNPYVYSQTSTDLLNLVHQVEGLAAVDLRGHKLVVKVMSPDGDYWPLPWYLRRFEQIGWWDHLPDDPYAPIMIVSAKLRATLDEKKTHLMVGYFQLRPQLFLELYVQMDLWQEWLAHHPSPTSAGSE